MTGALRSVTTGPQPPAVPVHARWAWIARPGGTLFLILLWAGLHTLLRLSLSSTLTADDAREAVLAQSLRWGYQARQPPLYNWLVWGAFRLIGPGLLALTLLKYLLLVLAFWLVYLTARTIVDDPRLATLGTFALILLLPIGWTVHEALTHSVLVLAACAGTVCALVRVAGAPSPLAYADSGSPSASVSTAEVHLCPVPRRSRPRRPHPPALSPARAQSADRDHGRRRRAAGSALRPLVPRRGSRPHDLYAREVRIATVRRGSAARAQASLHRPRHRALWPSQGGAGRVLPAICRRLRPDARAFSDSRLLGWLLAWMLVVFTVAAFAGGLGFLKARWLVPTFFLAPLYGLWRAGGRACRASGSWRSRSAAPRRGRGGRGADLPRHGRSLFR
jgi:hypothetical protein